jgi:hypothetical protein
MFVSHDLRQSWYRSLVYCNEPHVISLLLRQNPLTQWHNIRHSVCLPAYTLCLHPISLLLYLACLLAMPEVYEFGIFYAGNQGYVCFWISCSWTLTSVTQA